jgi:hypothetical protein
MNFSKSYVVVVNIDLDKCNNDSEWAIEDWEVEHGGELLGQIQEDIEDFIKENRKNV